MLKDPFQASAANPAPTIYSGNEGYRRILEEIKNSLYREIPEAKGRLELFDYTNPNKKDEFKRIAKSFGMSFSELNKACHRQSGQDLLDLESLPAGGFAIGLKTDNGKSVAISFGASSVLENANDVELRTEARRIVHEVFHGLDHILAPAVTPSAASLDRTATMRGNENFAEIGSTNLLVENGEKGLIIDLAVSYQSRLGGRLYPETEENFSQTLADIYDNADGYRRLQKKFADSPQTYPSEIRNFDLTGWRGSFETAKEIRQQMSNLTPEAVNLDAAQDRILYAIKQNFIGQAIKNIEPFKADLIAAGIDPKAMVEYNFSENTAKSFKYEKVSAAQAEAMPTVFEAQERWLDFLRERNFIPNADRLVNGYDLFDKRTTNIVGSNPLEASNADQLMAQAALQWHKTKDPLDKHALVEFAIAADTEVSFIDERTGGAPLAKDSPLSRSAFVEKITDPVMLAPYLKKLETMASGQQNFDQAYNTGGPVIDEYMQNLFTKSRFAPSPHQ